YATKAEVDAVGGIQIGYGDPYTPDIRWGTKSTDTTQQVLDKLPEYAMWIGIMTSVGGEYGTPKAGTAYGMIILWKVGGRVIGICNGTEGKYMLQPTNPPRWIAI
ncbi:MAG: hypothetical protein RSC25_08060, partial [Christensenella sp.]